VGVEDLLDQLGARVTPGRQLPGGTDDGDVAGLRGELDRLVSDAAGRPGDEHGLSRLDTAMSNR